MPFYLPKPLLIVSKNFRNIEESDHGEMGPVPIPNTFDHQAEYADVKANISMAPAPATAAGGDGGGSAKAKTQSGGMSTADAAASTNPGLVPPGTFKDGALPDYFYTYQIVFVPDLTQKYALKVRGGPGEVRAAMNLVNGWMFTGLGPFYLKDSSTAQNILATGGAITLGGRGVADVVSNVADLRKAAGAARQSGPFDAGQLADRVLQIKLFMDERGLRPVPVVLPSFAEIHVYEPVLTSAGTVEWHQIVDHCFDRQILGLVSSAQGGRSSPPGGPSTPGQVPNPSLTPEVPKPKQDGGKPAAEPKSTGSDTSQIPARQSGVLASGDPSAVMENAIAQGVASRYLGTTAYLRPTLPVPQSGELAGFPQRQAGQLVPAAPAGVGNNVTVNVNTEKKGWLCSCWPFSKCCEHRRPRITQDVVAAGGAEEGTTSTGVGAASEAAVSTVSGGTQATTGYRP
jgi:hypothetical protein